MNETVNDPPQKKILWLYVALGAGLALSGVPTISSAVVSTVLIIGVLIASYFMRRGADEDSLVYNHALYITRTIWIGGLIAAVMMIAASLYLQGHVNNEPMAPCMMDLNNFLMQGQVPDMSNMQALFQGCWDNYWNANVQAFIIAGIISIGPVLVYFLARYIRGFSRAVKGYRIAKPKGWF